MVSFIVNICLILAILSLFIVTIYRYLRKLDDVTIESIEEEDLLTFDIDTVIQKVNSEFIDMENQNLSSYNLSRKELEERKRNQARITTARKKAAYGDPESKKLICALIKQIIQLPKIGFNTETINEFIHFNNKNQLSSQDKTEILYYIYTQQYGRLGFEKMIEEHHLDELVTLNGEEKYAVTAEKISEVYDNVMSIRKLSYNDKLSICAQRIFEETYGFGGADFLFYTNIDEISGGVSGVPKNSYEIHHSKNKNITYTYESIWIVFHGKNIHMACMTFRNADSLVRVCKNIYKYGAPYVLSQQTGGVVSSMITGNRIVVAIPKFSNTHVFWARKFDSAENKNISDWFNNSEIAIALINLLKWMIRGKKSIAITGDAGTGKTTLIRSLFGYYPAYYTTRTSEMQLELNLNYAFPERNITAFQETQTNDAQYALNFIKKASCQLCIIGEAATAIQSSYAIQTSRTGSSQALFSSHHKTTKDLIKGIAADLMGLNLYASEKAAEKDVAEAINFDLHLENEDSLRFPSRLTEIIPFDVAIKKKQEEKQYSTEAEAYYGRQNQEQYALNEIFEYRNGTFILLNMPSDYTIASMRKNLLPKDRPAFDKEMDELRQFLNKTEAPSGKEVVL